MSTSPTPESPGSRDGSLHRFEELYLGSRRRLALQAYALTGDLAAARSAVGDAFVAARHHWREVDRLPDPEEWVRARAWAMARRRHVARPWHRERGLDSDQSRVLEALLRLPDDQRKVLLLSRLAALDVEEVGRELGETPLRVEQQLEAALASFTRETGTPRVDVVAALESLAPIVEAATLPQVSTIDRAGHRRRRRHAVAGLVVLLALTLLGGLFVLREGGFETDAERRSRADPKPRPVTEKMLLSLPQVRLLTPDEPWQLLATSDNTEGPGINSVCQATRFADPAGVGTFVRTFAAPGEPSRNLVQTVEISQDPGAASAAYRTTLGWFAGCTEARLQLLNGYRVGGLGEEAQVLKLRIPGEVSRTYVVGLVRTGSLTLSMVLETFRGRPVEVPRFVDTMTSAVRDLCDSDPSGPCPTQVSAAPVLPPPSGETRGTLASADLPAVGTINQPWVGTRPVPARPNLAATTCDKADFVTFGAPGAAMRTFLIPGERLPKRFGITETYGTFPNPRRADALVRTISRRMATCEQRDLGARVSSELVERKGYRGSEYALWRLDSEIKKGSTVGFWMGVARVGRYLAQVNFTPAGANDIDEVTFQALMTRTRDRLFELTAMPG